MNQGGKCLKANGSHLHQHQCPRYALLKFFGSARLDLELKDRFGTPVKPREWFLVPLEVIEEVIEKIKEGTIDQFRYDPKTANLIRS
jgi:hypothetical protein